MFTYLITITYSALQFVPVFKLRTYILQRLLNMNRNFQNRRRFGKLVRDRFAVTFSLVFRQAARELLALKKFK